MQETALPTKEQQDEEKRKNLLLKLEEQFPNSTPAERERYAHFKKGDEQQTCQALKNVLEWRQHKDELLKELLANHSDIVGHLFKDDIDDDTKRWNTACAIAIYDKYRQQQQELQQQQKQQRKLFKLNNNNGKHLIAKSALGTPLPKLMRCYSREDAGGNFRVVYVSGEKIDLQHFGGRLPGNTTQVIYANAMANYVDQLVEPATREKIVVIIECRKSKGHPNPNAARLLPMMQELSKLGGYLPQRLDRLYICPLPKAFVFLLKKVQQFLDKDVHDKLYFIPGSDHVDSKLSIEQMMKDNQDGSYFNEKLIHRLEQDRINSFISIVPNNNQTKTKKTNENETIVGDENKVDN